MGKITVVGLGFTKGQLTLEAAELLKSGAKVILHTERCGAAEYMSENGVEYVSLDNLYEEYEDFDEHAEAAADAVNEAAVDADVIYGVMDIRDKSAALLAEEGARLVPGPAAEGANMAIAADGTQF